MLTKCLLNIGQEQGWSLPWGQVLRGAVEDMMKFELDLKKIPGK